MSLSPQIPHLPWPLTHPRRRVGEAVQASGHNRWNSVLAVLLAGGLLAVTEAKFSWIEARIFAAEASRTRFVLAPGPSTRIGYPEAGPYDLRRGYSSLPLFLEHLDGEGFRIEEQARDSGAALFLDRLGIYPIYHEKSQAGIEIADEAGRSLYGFQDPRRIYPDFASIPPLVVQTVLFIENRHMLDEHEPDRNPAIEWGRLGHAVVDFGLHKVDRRHSVIGGSTLATQLEKLRHSPEGRTHSPVEKLRQIASATLRSYQDGPRTLDAQRMIIRDYINSIPLAATPEHGEVTGLGDGLAAWYGTDFDEVNQILRGPETGLSRQQMAERARAYREVLSLFLALRRPSDYLVHNPNALAAQTDRYLRALCADGVISSRLRNAALSERVPLIARITSSPPVNFVANKAAYAVRTRLLGLLGVDDTYLLDRLDLNVMTTIDVSVQRSAAHFFEKIANPQTALAEGLYGDQLLSTGNPGRVVYSFTLYERGNGVNLLRAQTDNLNQPLSVVDGTRLQLGSTAKLRTLINYLQIIEQLHNQYSGWTPAQLAVVKVAPDDRLTQWALAYLATSQDRSLEAMLNAALDRKYSGSPGEVFFTGGGRHVFANFERSEDDQMATVGEGFQQSINLVFIRLMRDIENYYKWRVPGASPSVLSDANDPARTRYLRRFADEEGSVFLGRFYAKYHGLTADEALETLVKDGTPTPVRVATIFRYVRPGGDYTTFCAFMQARVAQPGFGRYPLQKLYTEFGPGKFNLSDSGYLAHMHPLELWLVAYLAQHPEASLSEAIANSGLERQEVYRWLFRPKMRRAQDLRIGILLEQDAFHEIWKAWKGLGYPFDSLVPSYATSIGVSGDTPRALAMLAGIIANRGVRYPVEMIHQLTFARQTPMETTVAFHPSAGRVVLSPVIARLVYGEMLGVVNNGAGRRALGAFVMPNGEIVPVGGKTGTGDNRFKVFAPGGAMVSDRAVNRTATFVFIIGDRLFGTVTAFVPGEQAASYKFSSALAVQILKDLAPALEPLLSDGPAGNSGNSSAAAAAGGRAPTVEGKGDCPGALRCPPTAPGAQHAIRELIPGETHMQPSKVSSTQPRTFQNLQTDNRNGRLSILMSGNGLRSSRARPARTKQDSANVRIALLTSILLPRSIR